MQVTLVQIDNGACPYLTNRTWVSKAFQASELAPELYEKLIDNGWRRSGTVFYRNACPGCDLCIPLRVPVDCFRPSKSQRRVMRRNSDLTVTVEELRYRDDVFELYRAYKQHQHESSDDSSEAAFVEFLCRSPVPTLMMLYHLENKLVGTGWVDLLPSSVSSVYFAFHPEAAARSLGTYSITQEIAYARANGRPYLHLGFCVPGSRKMEYKARFHPNEALIDGAWQRNYPITATGHRSGRTQVS